MKYILLSYFLVASIAINAQDNMDTTAKRVVTATGKPNGRLTSLVISKEGGFLKSADGIVELIVPPGAVSKKTTFSIQPMTNMMPNARGAAYELTPSGTPFQKPVQLIFHYQTADMEDSVQLLQGMSMQGSNGEWLGLRNAEVDTAKKTVRGMINHFSTWATFDKLSLMSTSFTKRVKVGKTVDLFILGVTPEDPNADAEVVPLVKWQKPVSTIWRVNGTKGGSAEVGRLASAELPEAASKTNKYTAPSKPPAENPVAVSVDLVGASFIERVGRQKMKYNELRLVTRLLVYDDAWEIRMEGRIPQSVAWIATTSYYDRGSCVISIEGNEAKLIEKRNENLPDELDISGRCQWMLMQPGSGNIHVLGISGSKIIPADKDGYRWLEVHFKRVPVIIPLFEYVCPPIPGTKEEYTGDTKYARTLLATSASAFPLSFVFALKEEEQMIQSVGSESEGIYFRAWAKKIKED